MCSRFPVSIWLLAKAPFHVARKSISLPISQLLSKPISVASGMQFYGHWKQLCGWGLTYKQYCSEDWYCWTLKSQCDCRSIHTEQHGDFHERRFGRKWKREWAMQSPGDFKYILPGMTSPSPTITTSAWKRIYSFSFLPSRTRTLTGDQATKRCGRNEKQLSVFVLCYSYAQNGKTDYSFQVICDRGDSHSRYRASSNSRFQSTSIDDKQSKGTKVWRKSRIIFSRLLRSSWSNVELSRATPYYKLQYLVKRKTENQRTLWILSLFLSTTLHCLSPCYFLSQW